MKNNMSQPASKQEPLLWLVAIGFFMQSLDATILNTALPSMAASLGQSPLHMQSVVVAYALTTAMLIPATGWVADRFGTRRIYTAAMALFVLGSVLCALAPTLQFLVMARVVQGVGGAMMLPVGRLAVLRAYPRDAFIRAMSFIAIPGQVGPLMGPAVGGWLVEFASWHWIFWINVPIGIVGVWAAWRWMPLNDQQPKRSFDGVGFALLAAGMVGVSLALDGLSGVGMGHALVAVLLVFGMASLAAYWMHALRSSQPLFAPSLFSVRSLRVGLLGNLFARLGSGAAPFLVPLMLQVGLGLSPFHAGTMMLATVLGGMLVKRVAVQTVLCFGYKRVLQVNSVTLKDMTGESASSGNSLLSMVQMLAMSMGVAIAGAVLAGYADMWQAREGYKLLALQATFVTVGVMTLAATLVFSQLEPDEKVRSAPDGHD